MKKLLSFLLLLLVFGSDHLLSQNTENKTGYQISASCYPYTTALGKGKGIIFRVNVSARRKNAFTIDSFFVNDRSFPFSVKKIANGLSLESNYFKSKNEPSYTPGVAVKEPGEIDDELITQKKFYPSWIILTSKGKQFKLAILKYTVIQQNH